MTRRWPYRKFQQVDAHLAALRADISRYEKRQRQGNGAHSSHVKSSASNEELSKTTEMVQSLTMARSMLEDDPNLTLELAIIEANKRSMRSRTRGFKQLDSGDEELTEQQSNFSSSSSSSSPTTTPTPTTSTTTASSSPSPSSSSSLALKCQDRTQVRRIAPPCTSPVTMTQRHQQTAIVHGNNWNARPQKYPPDSERQSLSLRDHLGHSRALPMRPSTSTVFPRSAYHAPNLAAAIPTNHDVRIPMQHPHRYQPYQIRDSHHYQPPYPLRQYYPVTRAAPPVAQRHSPGQSTGNFVVQRVSPILQPSNSASPPPLPKNASDLLHLHQNSVGGGGGGSHIHSPQLQPMNGASSPHQGLLPQHHLHRPQASFTPQYCQSPDPLQQCHGSSPLLPSLQPDMSTQPNNGSPPPSIRATAQPPLPGSGWQRQQLPPSSSTGAAPIQTWLPSPSTMLVVKGDNSNK